MKKQLAKWVEDFLGRRGYKISRHVFPQGNSIDLRLLLAERIERTKGTISVVQIGANDGVTYDPIHHHVQSRGWSLLAVEPLGPAFERLTENYRSNPNVKCVQCAVANSDGVMTLYTLASNPDASDRYDLIASFSLDVLKQHWRRIPHLEDRIIAQSVNAVTLETLLNQNNIDEIDLLQIDTEGFDYEVIKMAFAAGLRPPIIAFEWTHLDQTTMWECKRALVERDYSWLSVRGDIVAAHKSLFTQQ